MFTTTTDMKFVLTMTWEKIDTQFDQIEQWNTSNSYMMDER